MHINNLFESHSLLGQLFHQELKTFLDFDFFDFIVDLTVNKFSNHAYLVLLEAHLFFEAKQSFCLLVLEL